MGCGGGVPPADNAGCRLLATAGWGDGLGAQGEAGGEQGAS
jgi:hypothetical protein